MQVATVVADEKDKINRAIVVTLVKEEDPRQWRFLSFREDVKTVIATITEKSEAARNLASAPEAPVDSAPEESASEEQEDGGSDSVAEAPPLAEEPASEPAVEVMEQPDEPVAPPVSAAPSSPKLRQRPPGMVVPKRAEEPTAAPKAASVIDSIRQRQQKEKLERQQYAERLRQKAESQSKAVSEAAASSQASKSNSANGKPTELEALLDLLPLAQRFAALFGLIFISSCIVMPNSIRAETYTDIFAAALFLAALDVAAKPFSLAAGLAALTRPYLVQHKAQVRRCPSRSSIDRLLTPSSQPSALSMTLCSWCMFPSCIF